MKPLVWSVIFALVSTVVSLTTPSWVGAQTLDDPSLRFEREVILEGRPFGVDVDPSDGTLYFILEGSSIGRWLPDGSTELLFESVGSFQGILSDLRLGPDGLLYAAGGMGTRPIQRFDPAGLLELPPLASVPGGAPNAFGLDFDCQRRLLISDTGENLYRVTPAGEISVVSTGWQDIDEIERGPNGFMFVHDGSNSESRQVHIQAPDGTRRLFATFPLPTFSGAYDWSTGHYYAASHRNGADTNVIWRVAYDPEATAPVPAEAIEVLGQGFGKINDINIDRASFGDEVWSLYVVEGQQRRIREISGLSPPADPNNDCGPLTDDDNDGFCERGVDLDSDGACLAAEEARADVQDCDDAAAAVYPGAFEACDGVDNDCAPGLADGVDEPDVGTACATPDVACAGVGACVEGALVCLAADAPGPELCDGVDNDCDPATLDGAEEPGLGDACDGDDEDLCPGGQWTCGPSGMRCSDDPATSIEICSDGLDNDCDGQTDAEDATCQDYVDRDRDGFCVAGRDLDRDGDCTGPGEPTGAGQADCDDANPRRRPNAPELCDGLDNDCDPTTPDGHALDRLDQPCDGPDADRCAEGRYRCSGGVFACSDQTGTSQEICDDGLDNDCDGVIDDPRRCGRDAPPDPVDEPIDDEPDAPAQAPVDEPSRGSVFGGGSSVIDDEPPASDHRGSGSAASDACVCTSVYNADPGSSWPFAAMALVGWLFALRRRGDRSKPR